MRKNKSIIIFVTVSVVVIGVMYLSWYLYDVNSYKKSVEDITVSDINLSNISNGVYVGSDDVGYIAAKVEVVVNDGKIEKITLLEHKNERGTPAEVITDNMIKEQKIDVDTISGATNSSKVIKKAVENALLQK